MSGRSLLLFFVAVVLTISRIASAADGLQAGAATADITPKDGVSLDGPISKNGVVASINDPLNARAVVLSDGSTRLAIVICDVCMMGRDVCDAAKAKIAARTPIPADHILIAGTHTHAAPRATHIGTGPLDDEYHKLLADRIADAVEAAYSHLGPAEIGWTSFQKPKLIACRRFLCKPGTVAANPFGETGERIKSVSGRSTGVIEPAGPTDPEFSVLSIRHRDGVPLAVLGNFSVHYCGGYQRGRVSADYFGAYSRTIGERLKVPASRPPVVGLMSNATSGNTGAIIGDGTKRAPYEWLELAGRMLAEDTIKRLDDIEYHSNVPLAMAETDLQLAVRKPDAERLEWARKTLKADKSTLPHRWSTVYAHEALFLHDYPDTLPIKLQAIRIGDLGIAAAPSEVFAETGLKIKAESPFKKTFTIELANGYGGYLPPRKQHELGGYETWPARSSFLEIDAEQKIREGVIGLLKSIAPRSE